MSCVFYLCFNNQINCSLSLPEEQEGRTVDGNSSGGSMCCESFHFMNPGRNSREEIGTPYTDSHPLLIKDGITSLLLVICFFHYQFHVLFIKLRLFRVVKDKSLTGKLVPMYAWCKNDYSVERTSSEVNKMSFLEAHIEIPSVRSLSSN